MWGEQAQDFMDESIKTFFRSITRTSKNKKKEEKNTMLKLEVEWIIKSIAIDTRIPVVCGMPK